MAWIKADHRFDWRMTNFYVGWKAMLMEQSLFHALLDRTGPKINAPPDELEKAAIEVIERYRPDLKGCTIFAMDWSIQRQQWEFQVMHGSLPAVPPGKEISFRPLDPAYERDLEASK